MEDCQLCQIKDQLIANLKLQVASLEESRSTLLQAVEEATRVISLLKDYIKVE